MGVQESFSLLYSSVVVWCRYHERERLLRPDSKTARWAAFMGFLYEVYRLLRRKQVAARYSLLHLYLSTLDTWCRYEGVAPRLVLLSLLAECCAVTLARPALTSTQEVTHPQHCWIQIAHWTG